MKSVLMSIQPKWCELIANGKKTVEVRKTRPKTNLPFKVYIYCTGNKQGTKDLLEIHGTDGKIRKANGKVIGEFVCDKIIELAPINRADEGIEKQACLSREQIANYLRGKGYGWHISDLVIYDKPKELNEFRYYNVSVKIENGVVLPTHKIERPPQSWCYVEGVRE